MVYSVEQERTNLLWHFAILSPILAHDIIVPIPELDLLVHDEFPALSN